APQEVGHRQPDDDRCVQRHHPARYQGDRRETVTANPARPASMGTPWWSRLASQRCLIAVLLVVAPYGLARAESAITPLLKPLDLVGYASRTPPPHFSASTIA